MRPVPRLAAAELAGVWRSTSGEPQPGWLLQSDRTPQDDPCWESKAWTDALKTDCVFRIGVAFQNMEKRQKAEQCYRQYLRLLSIGMEGSYSMDDVKRHVRELRSTSSRSGVERGFNDAVDEALEIAGFPPHQGRKRRPPPDARIPNLVAS